MKGLVFRTFLDMVEQSFSLDMVDKVIERSKLDTQGAYTSVGNYDYHELLSMVTHLSEITQVPVPYLVHDFGGFMLKYFEKAHAHYFTAHTDTFGFLSTLENQIHVDVRKIHQNAEVPTFDYDLQKPDVLVLTYRSSRPFADLAHGLIEATIEHYGEKITISRRDIPVESGGQAVFTLTKIG
jgi:hypothetical protein